MSAHSGALIKSSRDLGFSSTRSAGCSVVLLMFGSCAHCSEYKFLARVCPREVKVSRRSHSLNWGVPVNSQYQANVQLKVVTLARYFLLQDSVYPRCHFTEELGTLSPLSELLNYYLITCMKNYCSKRLRKMLLLTIKLIGLKKILCVVKIQDYLTYGQFKCYLVTESMMLP